MSAPKTPPPPPPPKPQPEKGARTDRMLDRPKQPTRGSV